MSERLTKTYNPCDECDYAFHKQNQESGMCKICEFKDYVNFAEQGLLLQLPCKVGDKAYHIIKDNIAIPPIYISEHEITDVSAKAVRFADDWWTFEEMYENNAFLNKAEAEKALAEMGK